MSTLDYIARGLIAMAAVPATLFPIIYFFRPWRSRLGWTLMVSEFSMALLIDASLLAWMGWLPAPRVVQIVVFSLILVGQCGLLWAVLATRPRHERRTP